MLKNETTKERKLKSRFTNPSSFLLCSTYSNKYFSNFENILLRSPRFSRSL